MECLQPNSQQLCSTAGVRDSVKCFVCGIEICEWQRGENPWIEHARWSHQCTYLKKRKGEAFVNCCVAQTYTEEHEDQTGDREASGTQVTADELERLLLTNAARSVLECGYQPGVVRRAIETIVWQNGRDGISSQSIMEMVLGLEQAREHLMRNTEQRE